MATGSIPCGIGIPQSFANSKLDLKLIHEFVPRAEALGYDSLWVQEQIITDAPLLEPVTLMTYAAALSSKARIGSSVLLIVIRNPVQLAKSLATLDQLSQGRLIAGIAIGGPHVPEKIFGVGGGKRSRRFIEALEVMKALWTQPKATYKGEYWQFENVPMEPKPLQKPHPPLWFGARTELGLKRAVRYGDGWMGPGSTSTADFAEHVRIVRRQLDETKRDPANFPISKRVYLAVDEKRERAERRLQEWFQMRYKNAAMGSQVSIWGGRAEVTDKLRELVRAGAQHLLLNPVFDEMEHAELLAREVMPHLQS
ncbi:MAG TPA: LLM class flavin-dependent oxidoreductase [Candidatus Binataceae bacterium]|nr:LLM class flavin-dependent oxidoreductase [Candidatus Binataceae bacterium]